MDKKTLNRRDFLKMAAVASVGVGLAACQPQTPTAAVQPTTAAVKPPEVKATPPSAETVTISFMGWGGPEESQAVKDLITKFEGDNPKIKVTWLHTATDYMAKLTAMIASGTQPDTLFTPQDYFKGFCKKGLMLDIEDYLKVDPKIDKKTYFLQPQEDNRSAYNGRWHGIGCCWVGYNLFYNADMFKEAGIEPPSNDPDKAWTWDYFIEVAKKFTKDSNGKGPDDKAFDPKNIAQWGAYVWGQWMPGTWAMMNGGQFIDPKTNLYKLDDPAAIEGIQNVADLANKFYVSPLAANFKDLGMSSSQMLENRKLAMAVVESPALSWTTKIKAGLGTACLPKMKKTGTQVIADVRAAMKATKNPEAAYKFVRMTGDPVYQSTFLKIGLWWPNQTALMTPEGLKTWISERKAPGDGVHPSGYYDLVNKYVRNNTEAMNCPPGYPEANAVINSALESVWNGQKTAQQAITESIGKANKILMEANS